MMQLPLWNPRDALTPDCVRIVVADTDALKCSCWLEDYEVMLAEPERRQRARFHFERDQHLYLVSHALLRTLLAATTGVPNRALQFQVNEYGRPEILLPDEARRLRFNLSHTHGMAACALCWERDVGVDVEDRTRPGVGIGIADAYFAPDEVAALRTVAPEDERSVFFTFWTLKEAYIKARGMGLALPLDKFSFDLTPGEMPRLSCEPEIADDPKQWAFRTWILSPRHALASAVRTAAQPVRWEVYRWDGTVPAGIISF